MSRCFPPPPGRVVPPSVHRFSHSSRGFPPPSPRRRLGPPHPRLTPPPTPAPLPHRAPPSRRFPSLSFPPPPLRPLSSFSSLNLLVVEPPRRRPSSSSTLLLVYPPPRLPSCSSPLTLPLGSARRRRVLAVAGFGFASPRCAVVVVPVIALVAAVVVFVRSLALRLRVVRSS